MAGWSLLVGSLGQGQPERGAAPVWAQQGTLRGRWPPVRALSPSSGSEPRGPGTVCAEPTPAQPSEVLL